MNTTFDLGVDLVSRLGKYAAPYEDRTPVDTIRRILDRLDSMSDRSASNGGTSVNGGNRDTTGLPRLDATNPPSLLHSRVRGTIGTRSFTKWNDLMRIAHELGFEKAGSFEQLKKMSTAPIQAGEYSDSGYHFLPELGLSIQGVDANRAWDYALQLAKRVPVPIEAVVQWRHNDKAARPGESALLAWAPNG